MKKILSLGLLMAVMSGTAQADRDFTYYGDDYRYDDVDYRFSDRSMGTRYRSRYKDPKLCVELREEVLVARDIFEGSIDRKRSLQSDANQANGELNSRKGSLERAHNRVMSANSRLQNLQATQARFDELMSQYTAEASRAQSIFEEAQSDLTAAQKEKESECNGWGSVRSPCRKAKRALEKAEKSYDNASSSLISANAQVDRLNRLPSDLESASIEVVNANQALTQEEGKLPAISELQSIADAANTNLSNVISQYNSDEDNYGRKAIRFEQCRRMAFEARKGKSYKRALIRLSKNNGENCVKVANRLLSSVRGYAAREGIREAYEDYCVSERLVRKVYIDNTPAN